MSAIKMMETKRVYRCTKCNKFMEVKAEIDQYNFIPKPVRCTASPENCNGKTFAPVSSNSEGGLNECIDYQEIKIQEQPNRLMVGSIPRSISVILQRDLVDIAKSGDHVTIVGTTIRRWRALVENTRPEISLSLVANSISVHNSQDQFFGVTNEMKQFFRSHWYQYRDDPIAGRDLIISSFCPQVYGLYIVKLAVVLMLIGGVGKQDGSGLKVRGETHMLLVGDPGTAKSQFLNYAAKISPRSVLTTGVGSTSAGLTVAAVKDGGEWMLEAGALVLADRGVCCIDEFNSIRESEKIAVHEAMEQQSVSGAKAGKVNFYCYHFIGMIINLNARCSVLAATNPKGKYDSEQSITVNVALASPLLSRFDIVLILLDSQNEAWDRRVSSFILNEEERSFDIQCETQPILQTQGQNPATPTKRGSHLLKSQLINGRSDLTTGSTQTFSGRGYSENHEETNSNTFQNSTQAASLATKNNGKFSFVQLQQYIAWVKNQFKPVSTEESEKILTKYYQLQRKADTRSAARTTIRLLESLIRISQAHARLMARDKVTKQDAIVTVMVMEASLMSSGPLFQSSGTKLPDEENVLNLADALHTVFPSNPNNEYVRYEKKILNMLNLNDLK
ncbi:DNA helicase MCM9 [Smittium mucronatum]|uniref:DNA helicase n=1 Tax=Smittium mucronatum TaxID=133383 RepID=A0A1R0GZ34_9FUNG|nr:DNA helicase MCM9 [Smittium mucronatum]